MGLKIQEFIDLNRCAFIFTNAQQNFEKRMTIVSCDSINRNAKVMEAIKKKPFTLILHSLTTNTGIMKSECIQSGEPLHLPFQK